MKGWHMAVIFLALGYAIGFWMPSIGDSTLAKLYPRG